MFPLTDLSILFTALLIIAFAFLGIFVLFGLLIWKKCNWRNGHQNTVPPQEPQTPLVPQPPIQPDLEGIKKEVVLGTNVAIYGLAFAFILYASQTILSGHLLQGLFGIILSLVMLILGSPRNRKSLGEYLTKHYKTFNVFNKIITWAFFLFMVYVFIILMLHL